MKAAIYKQYGPPEVVSITEITQPIPKDNEVLIQVVCSTINRTDSGFRSAEYVVSRFWSGLLRPKLQVLGSEFSGIIVSKGKLVDNFNNGDFVFGFNEKFFGGHAEYMVIDAHSAISRMPNNITFDIAAALTEGSHYALNNIRAAKVENGQRVMVYGATGSIGSAAVQLLKYFGAQVTAVCNTKNVELVKSLGADIVIDYQTEDYTAVNMQFDFIFDAVGKSSFGICKPLLKKQGIYISTELGKNGENIFYALTTPILKGKKVLFPIPTINQQDTDFLKELYEKGCFKPVIDSTYNLDEIVEGYKYVESGQKTGNVILRIKNEE
jgi:NADPH:quinone reductase-like Zn-dependent oxidoreductase